MPVWLALGISIDVNSPNARFFRLCLDDTRFRVCDCALLPFPFPFTLVGEEVDGTP